MKIGDYETVKELGRGGNAVVYEARSARGARVALKLLRSADAPTSERFAREADLQGQLGMGDGFVPLLGRGVGDQGPFIVMPLLEGGTLRDCLKRGPLPVSQALDLLRALAGALARAHGRGIVHRDMKPENVLFAADGAPYISDLGLGKLTGSSSTADALTKTGEFFGTIGYMAPEQLQGAREAGPPADVFALGVIAYECLAGRVPFPASGLVSYAEAVQSRPPALRSLRGDAPEWLGKLVASMLESAPERRPRDGAAVVEALEGAPRRRFPLVAAGVAAAVLLGVGAAVAEVSSARHDPDPNADPGPRPPVVARPSPDEEVARVVSLAAKNPAGGRAALEALTAQHPDLASAWRALCELELRERRPDVAWAAADKVLALEHGSASALHLRLRADARRHADLFAVDDASSLLRLEPGDADALAFRASAHESRNHRDLALRDARAALERAPGNALAVFVAVKVLMDKNLPEDALALAEKGVATTPGDARVWLARAIAMPLDVKAARPDLEKALALDPDSGTARFVAMQVDSFDQKLDAALVDGEEWIRLDPWNPRAWDETALRYPKEGDGLRVRRVAFLRQHPQLEELLDATIVAMKSRPHADRLALLDEILAGAPRNGMALFYRADLQRDRDPRAALPDFDRATEIHPFDAFFSLHKAQVLRDLGDREAARREVARGLSGDPPSWERGELEAVEKSLGAPGK